PPATGHAPDVLRLVRAEPVVPRLLGDPLRRGRRVRLTRRRPGETVCEPREWATTMAPDCGQIRKENDHGEEVSRGGYRVRHDREAPARARLCVLPGSGVGGVLRPRVRQGE